MHRRFSLGVLLGTAGLLLVCAGAGAQERQLTTSPMFHNLDDADNFSSDDRFLCFDTRGLLGNGIGNCQSIAMVEIASGEETILYEAKESVTGEKCAPGMGAAYFHPLDMKVAFIHGPFLSEVEQRGYYDTANRRGAEVIADGSGRLSWLDCRDVETSRDTLPGAHRGGSHCHEYSADGKRIGYTYNDFLMPEYDRTVCYMEKHPDAPGDALYYCALLVPVVPKGTSKPGEIEKAAGDRWVGRDAAMRSFIGKVRAEDGEAYQESLFVVDVPRDVDITTADSGSASRFLQPPKGTRIRRLTRTNASGAQGSHAGDRIAYLAKGEDGSTQVFLIPSDGSDQAEDEAKRPVQLTFFPKGAGGDIRWHPSDRSIIVMTNNAVVAVCVEPGARFGEVRFLTPQGDEPGRKAMVWSRDGSVIAFNKVVPTFDSEGNRVRNYKGEDLSQIFLVDFPDADADGIADKQDPQ